MSETIKISKEAKEELLRVAAGIQSREGHRVDLDEAIKYLLRAARRRSEILASVFGAVPGLRLEDLYGERAKDEQRAKRKFGL